jgi:glycosyltransferase involved in cell wall biosynthesis
MTAGVVELGRNISSARVVNAPAPTVSRERVRVDGKFFALNGKPWYVAGLTYGPFAPNCAGEFLPEQPRCAADLEQIRGLGTNVVRLYHTPPVWFLDEAEAHGLKVFVDVPWQKHRCFFEDWSSREDARRAVLEAAEKCGNHPATFALSVANEIPKDIARFYGAKKIERFLEELLDTARQQAPRCLMTYTNYPSTEYLSLPSVDFLSHNVYLENPQDLGSYLDRLQHIAGSRPLILGEFGLDSLRHGPAVQAEALTRHVKTVFRHGLAGSFVFSYTDEWFTGGHQIENWGFGITDRDRHEKPAAEALRKVWKTLPCPPDKALPKVSVVVCSYNGARTLRECLRSLQELDYPDYEVILVDDGSTDDTQQIAGGFPDIKYVRQENCGLSVARNVGAEMASGKIIAYTDSDCIADGRWLHYLVTAMLDQGVEAIGGPNIAPPSDCWIARCVAASPGGPSHVMLDDCNAEHVPGCNMAFDRQKLLELAGFDPQFRVAGDDVDICWRFKDAGYRIGFASSAVVWHHRRHTFGGYLRQQKGYGRAEGMLFFKHPLRFNAQGAARWNGVIYGEGAVGLPLARRPVWHGRFGTGLFQVVYSHNDYCAWAWPLRFGWHVLWMLAAALTPLWAPMGVIAVAMLCLTAAALARSVARTPLPAGAPLRYRGLVVLMHLLQPLVRTAHRHGHRLRHKLLPQIDTSEAGDMKSISFSSRDMYWRSSKARNREHLLDALTSAARKHGWHGVFDHEWERWDASLFGGLWHQLYLYSATEELGGQECFTRLRCVLRTTRLARGALATLLVVTVMAAMLGNPWIAIPAGAGVGSVIGRITASRRRCFESIAALATLAGHEAGLDPVRVRGISLPKAKVGSSQRDEPARAVAG